MGNGIYFFQAKTLREKCPYSELLWSAFFRIPTQYGEIRIRITPNTETFQAVKISKGEEKQFSLCSVLKKYKTSIYYIILRLMSKSIQIHNFYHDFMFLKLKPFLFVNVEDNTFGLNGKCLTSKTFYRRDTA